MEDKKQTTDTKQIEELKEIINTLTFDSILKGVRPTWISYEDFREMRSNLKKQLKNYKRRTQYPVNMSEQPQTEMTTKQESIVDNEIV